SGEYIIKAEENYNGENIVVSKSIAVIRPSAGGYLTVGVFPNPYHREAGMGNVEFGVKGSEPSSVSVRVYNVAGELVANLSVPDTDLGATLSWQVDNVASGVYIGLVEAQSLVSGLKDKKIVKVIVVK